MHRIDTATATAEGLWQPSNPATGQRATQGDADWFNDLQENLIGLLTTAGVAPVKGNYGQVTAAVEALIAGAAAGIQAAAVAAAAGAVPAAVAALNLIHPGDVVYRAVNAAPAGWLECDGSAVLRATYPALFAAIGTVFGPGDGATTFNLPDLRGEWLRGWDHGRGVDAGRGFGSHQDQQVLSHTHGLNGGAGVSPYGSVGGTAGGGHLSPAAPAVVATDDVTAGGGAENRVRNVALMAIIKT